MSERDIENLLYRYGELVDAADFDGIGQLFAHGRIAQSHDAPDSEALVGAGPVAGMYRHNNKVHPDGTLRTKHVITNAIIEIAPDDQTATARAYFTVFQQTDVLALQPIIAGRYDDRFARVAGDWAFSSRVMIVDLVGDLSEHLVAGLPD